MNRVSRSTEAQRLLFLESLAKLGNVTAAAEHAGLDRVALYRLRRRNKSFAEAWSEAAEIGSAGVEDEVIRRGAEGWSDPVFYRGAQCGEVRKYSDSLLMFLLKLRQVEKHKGDPDWGLKSLMNVLQAVDGTTRGLPSEREGARFENQVAVKSAGVEAAT